MTRASSRTYADGYGIWHAEIRGATDAAHACRLARVAIRRELARRVGIDPEYRVGVQLVYLSPVGGAYSLWRER